MNVWKKMPKGAKASVAFLFANVVSKGIAYITTPLYTRLLTPDEYGQVSVFLTWVQVLGIVAMFCLSYGVFNNGMMDYKEERDAYSFSMLALSNLITLCFSAILIGLYPFLKQEIGLDFPLVLLMCLIFLVQPAYNFYVARKRYELEYKSTVLWTLISAFASPLVALICIFFFENDLYARIFGAEITLIVIYAGFYIYIAFKGKWRPETKFWKSALLFNLPLIPHYLSTYLLGSSDKIIIARLVGDTATAYYSVAYSVASVATIIWTAVNSSLIPYTYEKCKKKDYKSISTVTLPILTLFAVVCILVILLAPEVVAIMATSDYREAIYVIPPVVGGVFFQMQYYIYANIIYYYRQPKYVMFASVTATLLNIALNYLFIPRFGYAAAGYTTIFCYFVQACIDYFALRHVVHEKIYNMRYVGILSFGVVIISLLTGFLYESFFIRYLIVSVMILCLIIFRRNLFDLFVVMKRCEKNET